jgi:hypothetical protein
MVRLSGWLGFGAVALPLVEALCAAELIGAKLAEISFLP